jgi:hypothetical protein
MKQLTVGLLFAVLAGAQSPESSNTTSVSSSIKDGFGQPVSGASISLQPDLFASIANNSMQSFQTYGGTSTDRGLFNIQGVLPGSYHLIVEKQGFLRQSYGGRPGSNVGVLVDVAAKTPVSKLDVVLPTPGRITGRLLSPRGNPIPGLRVSAARWSFADGKRSLRIYGSSGTSDQKGVYQVSGLAPGQYFVYAEPPPGEAMKLVTGSTPLRVSQTTYFPSALDAQGATPIPITAGIESLADIRVRQEPGFTVSGVVMGTDRHPSAGAVVVVMRDAEAPIPAAETKNTREIRDSPPYSMMVRTNAEGRFVLPNLPQGFHRIVALGGTRVNLNLGANISLDFDNATQGVAQDDGATGMVQVSIRDESLRNLVIHLQPGVEVTRKIHVEKTTSADILRDQWKRDGKAPPDMIAGKMLARVPRVTLVPTDGISSGGWFSPTPADETTQVSPGRYRIEVSGMPVGVYVKSIRSGGVDVTKQTLALIGGSAELDIVLAQGSGQVSGLASDSKGQPVSTATVSLWPLIPNLNQPGNGAVSVRTARDGRFTLYNVTPGEYYAAAFEDLPESGVESYPGFLARFTGQAVKVKLEPAKEGSVSPRLISRDAAARVISDLR